MVEDEAHQKTESPEVWAAKQIEPTRSRERMRAEQIACRTLIFEQEKAEETKLNRENRKIFCQKMEA
jgi:hypothetical protein